MVIYKIKALIFKISPIIFMKINCKSKKDPLIKLLCYYLLFNLDNL